MGETEAVSRASGWHRPANRPQGARAARRIRPELEPRWAHLRSRPFLYAEPFQTGGGALPPRARGEGGVERGPTPGRPRWWLVASRLPPTGHAGDWNPGRGSGLRAGEEGLTAPRSSEGPPGGAGAGVGGAPEAWHPRPCHTVCEVSPAGLCSHHLPSPPACSLAAALAHLAAGRGEPRLGAPGRLSRMLRGWEPCRCHGRSSLCCCPPLHQALKPGRPRPQVQPTPAFGFSFRQVFRVLSRLLRLSLETVPLTWFRLAPSHIGTSGVPAPTGILCSVPGVLRTWCPLFCSTFAPNRSPPCGMLARG